MLASDRRVQSASEIRESHPVCDSGRMGIGLERVDDGAKSAVW